MAGISNSAIGVQSAGYVGKHTSLLVQVATQMPPLQVYPEAQSLGLVQLVRQAALLPQT
jgi:hypothetical protein